MRAHRRTRRVGLVASGAALTLGLVAALGTPASAGPAAGSIADRITAKRADIRRNDPNLYNSTFATIEGNTYPDATPDALGGFQYYHGTGGQGAIYAHNQWGTIYQGAVYGNILKSWARLGWETGKGYPRGDEYTPSASDITNRRCPANTTRVQTFQGLSESTGRSACYAPGIGEGAFPFSVYWTS
jgi:LGFP repeat